MRLLAIALAVLLPLTTNAAPVTLSCKGLTDSSQSVIIRFDEEAKTFELSGKAAWATRRDKDGAAVVKSVTFTPTEISVSFKNKRILWLSLGATAAGAVQARNGTLDRVSGTWSLGASRFACEPIEESGAKF
jgi:hypothetical protein